MPQPNEIKAVFELLFPDIPVVYANETTIDATAMNAVPQWVGVSTLMFSMQHRIIEALKTTVPRSHPFDSATVMYAMENTAILNRD